MERRGLVVGCMLLGVVALTGCGGDEGARATTGPRRAARAPDAALRGGPLAFPGAEGFGATARGGRGGRVCRVTSLGRRGPGTLAACLAERGPRTVVFAVSGVIEGPLEIAHGQLTVAGQTSPSGITIRGGLICDNVYDPNDCNDIILRHLRLRGGAPDGLRIGGARDVMVDHCSIAGADDENVEITRSSNVTVQHSIIAEPRGEHYRWGGVLINYSKDVMPLDGISLHHDLWSGVAGRLPEISCEDNADGPGTSSCRGHRLELQLVNNVYWDVHDPIWFNRCTGTNEGNDCAPSPGDFRVGLELVGNVMARRRTADADLPFVEPSLTSAPSNDVFAADNLLVWGTTPANAALRSRATPHAFPPITTTPATSLVAHLAARVGAKPRDAMDTRIASYLARPVDDRPLAWRDERGVEARDAFVVAPPGLPPVDTDLDGMPDAWEVSVGLDPRAPSDGDTTLGASGRVPGCTPGYTALECYVNAIALD